jgi:hypothetical protein
MTAEEIMEVVGVIAELNGQILEKDEKLRDEMFCPLRISTDGYCINVTFLGECIWSSEDDDRKFDDDKNEFEHFDEFFKNKINELASARGKIRL